MLSFVGNMTLLPFAPFLRHISDMAEQMCLLMPVHLNEWCRVMMALQVCPAGLKRQHRSTGHTYCVSFSLFSETRESARKRREGEEFYLLWTDISEKIHMRHLLYTDVCKPGAHGDTTCKKYGPFQVFPLSFSSNAASLKNESSQTEYRIFTNWNLTCCYVFFKH